MPAEQCEIDSIRRTNARRAVLFAITCYFLAGCLSAALYLISMIPSVHVAVLRLGWWLGDWHTFPFPYDFADFASQPLAGGFGFLLWLIIVESMVTLTIAAAALHSMTFAIVVLAHAWFGWPKYWKDVRSRFNLRSAWARSARRSWWVWPITQFVWLLLDQIAWGYRYACYPIIDNGPPFFIANIVAACLIFGVIASHVLRASVIEAVGPDELRCGGCGYLLRGLTRRRCPECGSDVDRQEARTYGLWLKRLRPLRKTQRHLLRALIVAMLFAPVWLPLGFVSMPRTWLRFVPSAICPDRAVLARNLNAFPIRLDAVCMIQHENSVAVIRFKQERVLRADYQVGFWFDKVDMDLNRTPDTFATGQVRNGGGPSLPIGPWAFTYGMAGENMIWLTRPDPTYAVAAFADDNLSGELRLVVEAWDKREP